MPWTPLLLPIVLLATGGCSDQPAPESAPHVPPSTMVEGAPMYEVLPPGAIPSIEEPVFLAADVGDSLLASDEPVIGVIGRDGTAKAYSAWQLDHHEIVNDELDGVPIAVTW